MKNKLIEEISKFYLTDERISLRKLNIEQLKLLLFICKNQNEHKTN